MANYKVYLLLSAIGVSANAYNSRSFDHFSGSSYDFRHPFFDDDVDPLRVSASDSLPNYDYTAEAERFMQNPLDYVQTSASKRVLREDKFYKKVTPTFPNLGGKDRIKYRGSLEKLNGPICQKIKTKGTSEGGEPKTESLVCYECKEAKTGETFKHCSSQAGPKIDDEDASSIFRDRRSSSRNDALALASNFPATSGSGRDPYIFGDEYFGDASHDVPSKYTGKAGDCERIVKDTMVCMLCTDPKTNGKYEQCSYVAQPNEKTYAYSKKSSFGKPKQEANGKKEEEPAGGYQSSYSQPSERYYPQSSKSDRYSYPSSSKQPDDYYASSESQPKGEISSDDSSEKNGDSAVCKQVQKDSKTCTVCTDPKTGGNYEKCSYAYQPNDKVYKFSRSKSFGNPKSSEEKSKGISKMEVPDYAQKTAEESKESREYFPNYGYIPNYEKDYSVPGSPGYKEPERSESNREGEDRYRYPSYFDRSAEKGSKIDDPYQKSESERITESIDAKNCKQVEKDTMTCTVCQDPKTGGNLERCSYSYQPKDKVYSYSKAKSYGKPKKGENPTAGSSENQEKSQPYRTSYEYSYPTYGNEKQSENPAAGSSETKEKSKSPESSYEYTYPSQVYSYSFGSKGASSDEGTPSESSENPERSESYSRTYEYKPRKITYSSDGKAATSDRRHFDSSPKSTENSSNQDERDKRLPATDPRNLTVDFVDKEKKAELERFMKDFEKEDRSKCQKIMRDKMTCYQCLDEKGVEKEECMFVAEEKPAKDRLEYREVKQFKLDPEEDSGKSSTSETSIQRKPRRRVEEAILEPILEPIAAPTRNSDERASLEDTVNKENLKEIGPYEYVLETRPVYDKLLGLTLPAYMLEKSEHETEFDELVAAGTN